MKRASYRAGVYWIAHNDEAGELDAEAISGYLSTALLADLFDVDTKRVARDVLRERQRTRPTIETVNARFNCATRWEGI